MPSVNAEVSYQVYLAINIVYCKKLYSSASLVSAMLKNSYKSLYICYLQVKLLNEQDIGLLSVVRVYCLKFTRV